MCWVAQMLVEAETPDQLRHSLLVQNAETVRLVGPALAAGDLPAQRMSGRPAASMSQATEVDNEDAADDWRAASVSELRVGDSLFVLRQAAARHTGISVQESITEQ